MFQRILIVFFGCFLSLQTTAQVDTFYRTYMTSQNDTFFYHLASESIGGNLTSMGVRRFDTRNLGIVLFGQDKKGNITWQREIDFGQDTTNLIATGSLSLNAEGDSLYFSTYGFSGGDPIQYYGVLPTAGNEVDIRSVGGNEFFDSGASLVEIEEFIGGTQLVSPHASRATIGRVGPGFQEVWSKSYQFEDVDGNLNDFGVFDLKSTVDSTMVVLGGEIAQMGFMVSELDSNGVQLWSEDFDFSNLNVDRVVASELVRLENGNTAIIGSTDDSGFSSGYVIVLDSMGSITSSFDVQVEGLSTNLRDVIQGSDGNLWISGVVDQNDSLRVFVSNISETGTVQWTSTYSSPNNVAISALRSSDLHLIESSGGAVFGGHGFDNDMDVYASFKLSSFGDGFCSDTITTVTTPLTVSNDTLIASDVLGGMFFSDVDYEYEVTTLLTPPVLNVSVPGPFCPNEPLDTILVARVTGAAPENLIFEWADGTINDTLRITEVGQYIVTVTVSEDVCYEMCDTVMVSEYGMPMLTLFQNEEEFCETGEILVGLNYQGGHPDIQSISWNTGESSETINVVPPTTVSATVIDACGQPVTATLDVAESIPAVTIFQMIDTCGVLLSLNYSGPGEIESVLWSTDENTEQIEVTENGNYSVLVTNTCGDEVIADVNVEFDMPEIMIIETEGICVVQLTVDYSGLDDIVSYNWSTGETSDSILVLESGSVGVEIVNSCGETLTANINVDVPDAPAITFTAGVQCLGNRLLLQAGIETVPATLLADTTTFTWFYEGVEQGEGPTLSINNDEGNYGLWTVEASNNCGVLSQEVDVLFEDLNPTLMIECFEDGINNSGATFSITDSNGDLLENVNVEFFDSLLNNSVGMENPFSTTDLSIFYRAIVRDPQCSNQVVLDTTTKADILCGTFYNYPNVFFPDGSVESERTFGPIPTDSMGIIDLVTESEFKIFNRWGQEVFSSDEVLPTWDGTQGGSDAPSEVYIYYHRYRVEGREEDGFAKGDVTLIR